MYQSWKDEKWSEPRESRKTNKYNWVTNFLPPSMLIIISIFLLTNYRVMGDTIFLFVSMTGKVGANHKIFRRQLTPRMMKLHLRSEQG